MENKEMDILHIIAENPYISQRKIADATGMSLGMINILIKKCVKKGFVKIEHLTAKSVRYLLTPRGIEEKTRKTLEYINRSYRAIVNLTTHIRQLTEKQVEKNKKIWILGKQDEMQQLVINTLKEMSIEYGIARTIKEIPHEENIVIYIWDPVMEEEVKGRYYIHILTTKGKWV